MKGSFLVGALAFAMALLAGCAQAPAPAASTSTAASAATVAVDADYVAQLDGATYLIDVRTPEEYAAGHIPGALNASYPKSTGGPCQAEENASSFRAAWAQLGIPTDAHVVVYCRTGVRAAAAASALAEDGYRNVEVYEGSWTDWTSDPSRPVES